MGRSRDAIWHQERRYPGISRIVLVTSFLEVFHRVDGRDAAKQVALARRGKAFDPAVVDAFLSVAQKESFWRGLEQEGVWDSVLGHGARGLSPSVHGRREAD